MGGGGAGREGLLASALLPEESGTCCLGWSPWSSLRTESPAEGKYLGLKQRVGCGDLQKVRLPEDVSVATWTPARVDGPVPSSLSADCPSVNRGLA